MIPGRQVAVVRDILSAFPSAGNQLIDLQPIGGGDINQACAVRTEGGLYFIKYNDSAPEDMFEKEAYGLQLLKNTNEIKVPAVIGHGKIKNITFLILEFLKPGPRPAGFWDTFGYSLARLHKFHQSEKYGLEIDNYIGRLYQPNKWQKKWIDFFISERLDQQVKIAVDAGFISTELEQKFRKLYNRLPDFLPDDPPSLIHGDLWSGNFLTGPNGQAALIDPAVYYGNRETEISFTLMFGGFEQDFYISYNKEYPLQPGFMERVELYNLYPSLVHLNMFGKSYLGRIDRTVRKFVD